MRRQTTSRARIQDMQSKLLDAGTPAGPVPNDEEVQVTLVLKHAGSTAADAAQGAHIQQLTSGPICATFFSEPRHSGKNHGVRPGQSSQDL